MCFNLPLHSVGPRVPRSHQIWSSFIVGKSVFATFFLSVLHICPIYSNARQCSLLTFEFYEIWVDFRAFQTKIFLPRSAKHFQSGFKLELVVRVLTNSLARPVTIRGRSGARCYVFSVWYVCRIAFTLRVLLFIRLGWQPWTHAAMRPHCHEVHTSLHGMHAAAALQHAAACHEVHTSLHGMHAASCCIAACGRCIAACEVNSIARAHTIGNS